MTVKRLRGKRRPSRPDRLPPDSDTPVRLLNEIREGRQDPRDLSRLQRQACLMVLANGKQTTAELAALFSVSPTTIRKDMGEIRRTVGREVREWGVEEVVGQLALAADRYSAHAMRQEDPALAWSIQRDLARLLKELGVVGGEARDGMRITIEALGEGYERAREALGRALDPRLTGEVVEDEDPLGVPPLALEARPPESEGPRARVEVEDPSWDPASAP